MAFAASVVVTAAVLMQLSPHPAAKILRINIA